MGRFSGRRAWITGADTPLGAALARALYASTDLNQVIPPELYNAVAEVLVYLYRMDQKIP